MAVGFGQKGLLREFNALNVIATVVALTAGSAFVMWLGEQVTEKGIGPLPSFSNVQFEFGFDVIYCHRTRF